MPFYDILQVRLMLQMIGDLLHERFGEEGAALIPSIRELWNGKTFLALHRKIGVAANLDDVRQAIKKAVAAERRREKKRQAAENA